MQYDKLPKGALQLCSSHAALGQPWKQVQRQTTSPSKGRTAFANSIHKPTYFNTRRAFMMNRKLDMMQEKDISALSQQHGGECNRIAGVQRNMIQQFERNLVKEKEKISNIAMDGREHSAQKTGSRKKPASTTMVANDNANRPQDEVKTPPSYLKQQNTLVLIGLSHGNYLKLSA